MKRAGFSAADCLALVEQSPAAVAVHDKAKWLGLFANGYMVEDPVGSRPHCPPVEAERGRYRDEGPLGDFYETFIAANDIRFNVQRDIVCGLHVVRDLSLEITMSPQLTVRVPMHLLYELEQEAGALRISRLAAHWELWPMLRQQLDMNMESLRVGALSGARMLRHLGARGVPGFLRALTSVGEAGKRQVFRFAQCFNGAGDPGRLFATESTAIAFPFGGRTIAGDELAQLRGELSFEKLLAAGNVVSASCRYRVGERDCRGVAFFEFERRSLAITALSFYWQDRVDQP